MSDTLHRLQQHILRQLVLHSTQRYADLKPSEIEGNLFMYHLRCLMKEGWIEKCPDGKYQLSSAGKAYVDRLSLKSFTPRIQPRIVTLMAVKNNEGQWLMYRRKRQPLIDTIGFPYGKIHIGETIDQAAVRELEEKTGLSATLHHYGDGYANVFEDDKAISQIMFHLFYGTDPQGELRSSEVGETTWLSEAEFSRPDIMPNATDLLNLVKAYDGRRFFVELNHRLSPAGGRNLV